LADLKRSVVHYGYDLGLGLDADGDRFGVVDEQGDFVNPNRLAYLLLEHLLSTRTFRGPVCRSLSTTHNLDRIARQNGLSVIETRVGFKYISECLREKGCILGVEESGGLSIFGHVPEKDGILVGLLAAEMIAATGKTFRELNQEAVAKYGLMETERLDVKVTALEGERILADLKGYQPKAIAGIPVDRFDETEGKKIILEDDSWVLVRPSGTEPLIRIYIEAPDRDRIDTIRKEITCCLSIKPD